MNIFDPLEYIPQNFQILTKADENGISHLMPMTLWAAQEHYIRNRTHRDIILKGRQMGISTGVLAANFHHLLTHPYTNIGLIAHKDDVAEFLLQTVHRFYDHLPDPRPKVDWKSASRIRFPLLDASIHIESAAATTIGRGENLNTIHLSEIAQWYETNTVELFAGITQTVSLGGFITIECYDEETEVMTDGGWVKFKELNGDSLLLSKDRLTNKAYYAKPIRLVKERVRTKLIHFLTEYVDLLVTSNHNIWCAYGQNKSFNFMPADRAEDTWRFAWDTSFIWEGWNKKFFHLPSYRDECHKKTHPGTDIPMDLFLQYLGYFVSEGWISGDSIAVGQSYNSSSFDNMRICCEKVAKYLDKSCHVDRLPQHANFRINDIRLVSYLLPYTKPKRIPREFMDLSRRQLRILLGAYWEGDGERARRRCFSVSKELADSIQEILFKLGFRATIRPRSGTNKNWKDGWTVSYTDKQTDWRRVRYKRDRVDYDGYIYCVRLASDNLLLVRRNGKVVWSGNSTPRGRGGFFYRLYEGAKRGDIPYKTFFYPWWYASEYQLPIEKPLELNREERLLVDNQGLTHQQIAWRRLKIAELKDLFYQEYPENDVDCWLSSETSVFDGVSLRRYLLNAKEGRKEGNLTIWKDAMGGKSYIIGVDVGGGLPKGDFSVACVLDTKTNEHCATLRGRIAPDLFAEELVRLGNRYNNALMAVERMSHGHTVLRILLEHNYPRLYYYRDYNVALNIEVSQPGWLTSGRTRPMMIDTFSSAIRSGDLITWSENLLKEASSFQFIGQKAEAPAGEHDDELMAMMIAVIVREQTPVSRGSRFRPISYIKL